MYKYVVYDGSSVASGRHIVLFDGSDLEQAQGIANEYGGIVYKFDAEDTNLVDGELVCIGYDRA